MIAVKVDAGRLPAQLAGCEAAIARRFWQRFATLGMVTVEREQDRHFERQETPDGAPWAPSLRAKRQKGLTLVNTAALRGSVTAGSAKGAVRRRGQDFFEVGTRIKYAGIHQFGGTVTVGARRGTLAFGKKGRFMSREKASARRKQAVRVAFVSYGPRTVRMPARPFLGVGPPGVKELGSAARRTMDAVLREAAR